VRIIKLLENLIILELIAAMLWIVRPYYNFTIHIVQKIDVWNVL